MLTVNLGNYNCPYTYEALLQLIKGKTVKEAARVLNISHRTVEDYIARAKEKSNCVFRAQLFEILRKNLFITNFRKDDDFS
ncbi:MAG: helix-turn-helix domain-containing protein [Gammaproteobacteria bacterium]|nr:helix-turn-helix domain-containing protein [Gammaproteobacteria bacterium]